MLLLLVAPDKYGLVRVQELATRAMCGGHDPGGYATGARELGRVLAPLIDWLLFADRMSAQSHALNAVAATVAAAPRFWGRIASATDALVGDPSLAAAAVALPAVGSGLSPLDHWTGVLGAVARFCTLCLERFPGTPVPGPDRDALLRVAASIADHPLAPAMTMTRRRWRTLRCSPRRMRCCARRRLTCPFPPPQRGRRQRKLPVASLKGSFG